MTREMYESLALTDLKAIAKKRGMKRTTGLKKAELIDAMMAQDVEDAKAAQEERARAAQVRQEERAKAAQTQQEERGRGASNQQPERNAQSQQPERRNPQQTSRERQRGEVRGRDRENAQDTPQFQPQQPRQPYGRGIRPDTPIQHKDEFARDLDSGELANGILEVMPDGYGFIRCENYLPGENDV